MRVRKKPGAQELLDNTLVINDAPEKKGKWKEYFGNDHPIYVEIGCGKGGFLRKNAEAYPDVNFIGIERQEAIVAMAARRADEELPNRRLSGIMQAICSDLSRWGSSRDYI